MKKIQKALKNYPNIIVEIYSSHFCLYDKSDSTEIEVFGTKKDLLNYIKNQLK